MRNTIFFALVFAQGALSQDAPCTMAGAMQMSSPCANENPTDAAFCTSPCYQVLQPFMDRCQSSLPSFALSLLGSAVDMLSECETTFPVVDPDDLNPFGECDIGNVGTVCGTSPPPQDATPAALCSSPCMVSMMACSQNTMLASVVGQDTFQQVQGLADTCSDGAFNPSFAGGDPGSAGDGVCQLVNLGNCDDLDDDDVPIEERCTSGCVLEAIDCINNPVFAMNRDDIANLQSMCSADGITCFPLIQNMGDALSSVCCPDDASACDQGPPTTCSTNCAAAFNPLFDQCYATMASVGMDDDHEMTDFYALCGGGGGH